VGHRRRSPAGLRSAPVSPPAATGGTGARQRKGWEGSRVSPDRFGHLNPVTLALAAAGGVREAVSGWAASKGGTVYLPHRSAARKSRPWAVSGHGPNSFSLLFFHSLQFCCFLFSLFLANFI
jgi:hypothetical protein